MNKNTLIHHIPAVLAVACLFLAAAPACALTLKSWTYGASDTEALHAQANQAHLHEKQPIRRNAVPAAAAGKNADFQEAGLLPGSKSAAEPAILILIGAGMLALAGAGRRAER